MATKIHPDTYENLWQSTMHELRQSAAKAKTFGDYDHLEKEIEHELEQIRGFLKESQKGVRQDERLVARFPDWEYAHRSLASAVERRSFERSIRDELKQGLTALRKLHRQEWREVERILDEWKAEKRDRYIDEEIAAIYSEKS